MSTSEKILDLIAKVEGVNYSPEVVYQLMLDGITKGLAAHKDKLGVLGALLSPATIQKIIAGLMPPATLQMWMMFLCAFTKAALSHEDCKAIADKLELK